MKQVIVVRKDIKMSKGKMAAQCCHGSLNAYKNANPSKIEIWENEGQAKVVLKIQTLEELIELKKMIAVNKVPHHLVIDAGRTELPESTVTCLGIGPDTDEIIDKLTGHLKLY
ncbi:peptidyl-tRNA hydrolase Pth2 [Methanobrevibacter filiformis]|uniref:Peptidyl-tRNA hydrolase n=1 Tax=Methanobrevibacter filiformis TaxID=55758 RepID=A0A166ERS6_9EURY|nr:peptidyl-tRNA hydrolase Pth2 [Methanobrevibacter filiformis]KZX16940.1 peptidyl-tRNA hydrolase [Methanobrevibacter filiformis]